MGPDSGVRFWKVAGLGYAVIFVAEWVDLPQVLTAGLTASITIRSRLGLARSSGCGLAVGLLAILDAKTLLKVLPIKWITLSLRW